MGGSPRDATFSPLCGQLLETAPIVTVLFLVAFAAVLLPRRRVSALQIFTVAALFAFYFPFVLYLSVQLSFPWALGVALTVPGLMFLNFMRQIVGPALGVLGGTLAVVVYQLFPTLTAFAGWNRGLVLLCVGTVTLFVVVDLQRPRRDRSAMASAALVFAAAFLLPGPADAQSPLDSKSFPGAKQSEGGAAHIDRAVRVSLPAEWVRAESSPESVGVRRAPQPSTIVFGVADYSVRVEQRFVEIDARIPIEVLEVGELATTLFTEAIFLQESELPEFLRTPGVAPTIDVVATEHGQGVIELSYRAPLGLEGERFSALIPLARTPAGHIRLVAKSKRLDFQGARLWSSELVDEGMRYELGVAGHERLEIGWKASATGAAAGLGDPDPTQPAAESGANPQARTALDLYGIGIISAHHLSVLRSDGSAQHFAVYRLPAFAPEFVELRLPGASRVVSVVVDGHELDRPELEGDRCRVRLDADATSNGRGHELVLRLDLGRNPLAFLGAFDLELPDPGSTVPHE